MATDYTPEFLKQQLDVDVRNKTALGSLTPANEADAIQRGYDYSKQLVAALFGTDGKIKAEFLPGGTPTTPTITVMPTTLTGFTTTVGTPSTGKTFTVTGENLTGTITVTAPAGYQVSRPTDTGYGDAVTLPAGGGTIYVRLTGEQAGTPSGNVTLASGATTKTVAVTGTVTAVGQKDMAVAVGNSCTAGYGLPAYNGTIDPTNGYPAKLAVSAASKYGLVANKGVSGNTVRQIINRLPNIIAAFDKTTYRRIDVYLLAGINDAHVAGLSNAQIVADYTELIAGLKAGGADHVYLLTLPACVINGVPSGATAAQITAQVNDLNALIRANYAAYGATGFVDLARRTEMQNPSATYFQAEGGTFLHPNVAGATIMAGTVTQFALAGTQPTGPILTNPLEPPVGYTGAVAPEFVDDYQAPVGKLAFSAGWGVTDVPGTSGGYIHYLPPNLDGEAVGRGLGTRFQLYNPGRSADLAARGTSTLIIDGGEPLTVSQAVVNPDGGDASYPYYTSPYLDPAIEHTVIQRFTATPGIVPINDGIKWLNH